MIKAIAANISLALGAVSALITLSEWYLGESAKRSIERKLYISWLWLADHKSVHMIQWLKNNKVQTAIYIIHVLGVHVFRLLSSPDYGDKENSNFIPSAFFGYFLFLWIVGWMCSAPTVGRYFGRMFSLLIPAGIIASGGLYTMFYSSLHILEGILYSKLGILCIVLWGVALQVAGLLLDILILSILMICLHFVTMSVLKFLELNLRRILEQPKGFWAGTTALLTTVGVLLKSFNSG